MKRRMKYGLVIIIEKPSAELVAEIAKVFGLKSEDLMGGEDKIERV